MLSEATRSSSNGPGISFARLESSLKAINMFYQGIADLRGRRLLSSAKSLARVSTTYLAALFANKSECIHSSQASSVFTSLTLDIDMLPKALAETTSDGHAQATARSLVKFYRVRPVSMQNRPASRARAATGAALSSHRDPRPALARRADIRVHEGVVSADRSFAHQLHRLLC